MMAAQDYVPTFLDWKQIFLLLVSAISSESSDDDRESVLYSEWDGASDSEVESEDEDDTLHLQVQID